MTTTTTTAVEAVVHFASALGTRYALQTGETVTMMTQVRRRPETGAPYVWQKTFVSPEAAHAYIEAEEAHAAAYLEA